MNLDYAKELAAEIAHGVIIRHSKHYSISEEEIVHIKKSVRAEVLLALAGQISTDDSNLL